MKERKVINKVFSKSNCIISDELMRIYDDRINDTIRKEYENGWNIISCTPLICQDGSEIIYTMIFENDIIDNSNINSCEDERKYNNDVMKEIEKEYENGKEIFYKRTIIDTSGDDEFKKLIKTEYPKAPNYIKYMIEDYKHRCYINITRNYEDIGMTSIHDWIENNKNKYAIPKPIPATDAIIGTITIACVDDNVRGFITYGELLKYDNDKYIVRASIEKSTTTIKVIYFKPLTKERDVK